MTRAAVHEGGRFEVRPVQLPPLADGQLRLAPIAAGICGTDLSAWQHTEDFLASLERFGAQQFLFDPAKPLVFGHEFTARVLEVGQGVTSAKVGDAIFVSPTIVEQDGQFRVLGFSNTYPGGLSEEVIAQEGGHLVLGPGVDPIHAAVLDPICTGIEGVRRTGLQAGQVALVTGTGPVGLGAVVEAVARGAAAVVASDPSPRRRELALAYGATVAVDPATDDPIAVAESLMPAGTRLALIEASGAQGLLTHLLQSVPRYTVIGAVGAASGAEQIFPVGATTRNVTLTLGSGPDFGEQRYESLYRGHELIQSGAFDPGLMVTAYTGLAGTQRAFDALRPSAGEIGEVKILIVPDLDTDQLLTPQEFAAVRS